MSVAYYIVPEKEIEEFDCFVDGKAVAHVSEEKLEKLCKALGVKPLTHFFRQVPEELAELLEADNPDSENYPAQEWFDAQEGITTVAALIDYLKANPADLENSKKVAEDLEEYLGILEHLAAEKIRWNLALDF